MRRAALGLYSYAEFFAQIAFFLPVMAASSLRHRGDPTQRMPGRWMRRFGRAVTRASPIWKFSIEGDVPSDIGSRGYVVVANHESSADPFLLSFLPWDMRWVAKEELFRMPVIGWMMRCSGDIPLRRGDAASVARMMEEARSALAHGQSVMMFPEGTRSASGELGAFKDGAFKLAVESGAPVLPVALAGTRACRPKGSLWFGEAHAIARILPPMKSEARGEDSVGALRDEARRRIAEALSDVRGRTS